MKKTTVIIAVFLAVASLPGPALSKEADKAGSVRGYETIEARWRHWMRDHIAEGQRQLRDRPDDSFLSELNNRFICWEVKKNICMFFAFYYLKDGTPIVGVDDSVYDDAHENKLKTLRRRICDLHKAECWIFETNKRTPLKKPPPGVRDEILNQIFGPSV